MIKKKKVVSFSEQNNNIDNFRFFGNVTMKLSGFPTERGSV